MVKLYSPNAAAHNHRPEGFSSPPCSAAASLTELVSNAAAQKRKRDVDLPDKYYVARESLYPSCMYNTHSLHCSKKRRTTNLLQLLIYNKILTADFFHRTLYNFFDYFWQESLLETCYLKLKNVSLCHSLQKNKGNSHIGRAIYKKKTKNGFWTSSSLEMTPVHISSI